MATEKKDERIRKISRLQKFLARPDFSAISGTLLVFLFFIIVAGDAGMFNADGIINWSTISAYLVIIAVGASLLMIAGEFDLSIGSMIGFAGVVIAVTGVQWGWPIELAVLSAFVCAMLIGYINGYVVIKTGLPSFIVTLAFLFILRGLTLALSVIFTNSTIIGGISDLFTESFVMSSLFQGVVLESWFTAFGNWGWIEVLDDGQPLVKGIPKVLVWALLLVIAAHIMLTKMRFGNWIFASGGDPKAARNVGVPANRVKIMMFMFTAFCATLYATIQVAEVGSAAADRGLLKEFEAIIAAVIGGCLLTGGYGSVIGAAFGAIIFGVVQIGISYTAIDSNWFRVFLGLMLLIAVLFNNFIRKKITEAK